MIAGRSSQYHDMLRCSGLGGAYGGLKRVDVDHVSALDMLTSGACLLAASLRVYQRRFRLLCISAQELRRSRPRVGRRPAALICGALSRHPAAIDMSS
jgi:hypothetical protein